MGIFIKNPETERVVRELAAARGDTITGVIDKLAREALEREQAAAASSERTLRNLAQMRASNERFRRISGLDKQPARPVTKAEWDALWPTGIPEIDDA
ncbi:type II toxin-antitoxin system VapB family antitoxin [Caulobacter mirabilis]|nr:type II toxin-antitoxin system VapB family antitoxin [Caulobacter mirabilis]